MRFSMLHLLGFVAALCCLLATSITSYRHGWKEGKRDAFRDSGISFGDYDYQIRGHDGFYMSIERLPQHCKKGDWGYTGPGEHVRAVSWTDQEGRHMFHDYVTYHPIPEEFLGPKSELPEILWRRNLTDKRPVSTGNSEPENKE